MVHFYLTTAQVGTKLNLYLGWVMKKMMMNNKNKNTGKNKKNRNFQYESRDQDRTDRMQFTGIVDEVLPSTMFKVKLDDAETLVTCVLAGKLKKNKIWILAGDKVTIEVSPYDMTKGRIVWRGR